MWNAGRDANEENNLNSIRKRTFAWWLTSAAFVGIAIAAGPVCAGRFLTVTSYRALDVAERTLVVEALADMHSYFGSTIRNIVNSASVAELDRYERCMYQVKTSSSLRQMFDSYLDSNPDAEQFNLASDFAAMLRKNCP
jgi:hypothetical protein